MIRVALIGCGHIGMVHAFAFRQLAAAGATDAVITAVFDPDGDRARALANGARVAPTLEAALDDVDGAWICTWTAAHRAAVEEAVARRLPVFCEKPLGPSLPDCESIAASLRSVPHQVGLVLRHAPVFAAAAEAVASGRFGRALAAILRNDQYFPIQGMYGSDWRADAVRAGGGTLIEHSIHDVDLLRWILGDPVDVAARTASNFGHPGIEDVATVTFRFAEGAVASLVSVWHQVLSRPSTRRLELFCEHAVLWTDDDYLGPLHVLTTAGEELIDGVAPEWVGRFTLPQVLAKPLGQYAAADKVLLDVLGSLEPDRELASCGHPDVEVALGAHRLVDAAYRSAASGGHPVRPA